MKFLRVKLGTIEKLFNVKFRVLENFFLLISFLNIYPSDYSAMINIRVKKIFGVMMNPPPNSISPSSKKKQSRANIKARGLFKHPMLWGHVQGINKSNVTFYIDIIIRSTLALWVCIIIHRKKKYFEGDFHHHSHIPKFFSYPSVNAKHQQQPNK